MIDKDMSALAGDAMSSLLTVKGATDEYITDRLSVADLWLILDHLIPVVRDHLIEKTRVEGLSPEEALIWNSMDVRRWIIQDKKIRAIKEARSLTGMDFETAVKVVERMETSFRSGGGGLWVL